MWWGRLVLIGAAAITPAVAQSVPAELREAQPLETVVVRGAKSCVIEQADGSRALSYDCLNAGLQQNTEGEGAGNVPTLDARALTGRGNPEALGTFSYTATAIRMGKNFGKSVYPERPPATSYTSVPLPKGENKVAHLQIFAARGPAAPSQNSITA